MAKKKDKATVTIEAGGKSATVDADKFNETLGQAADRIAGGRMTTMATIKSVKIDKDGSQILLENCKLSGSQYKKLSGIVADQTIVDVTIFSGDWYDLSELPSVFRAEEQTAND